MIDKRKRGWFSFLLFGTPGSVPQALHRKTSLYLYMGGNKTTHRRGIQSKSYRLQSRRVCRGVHQGTRRTAFQTEISRSAQGTTKRNVHRVYGVVAVVSLTAYVDIYLSSSIGEYTKKQSNVFMRWREGSIQVEGTAASHADGCAWRVVKGRDTGAEHRWKRACN